MRVAGTGLWRVGYGLRFSDPSRTRDPPGRPAKYINVAMTSRGAYTCLHCVRADRGKFIAISILGDETVSHQFTLSQVSTFIACIKKLLDSSRPSSNICRCRVDFRPRPTAPLPLSSALSVNEEEDILRAQCDILVTVEPNGSTLR